MRRAALVAAFLLLAAGCGQSDRVAAAVDEWLPDGAFVVSSGCSKRGTTASGYEHWVCVVQYPPGSEFGSEQVRRLNVAWDGERVVRVERR